MKILMLLAAGVCLAVPHALDAQVGAPGMVGVGSRVRVTVTETVLPSPRSRPGRLRRIVGTVTDIQSDTIRIQGAAEGPPDVVPRLLIYKVERSLGRGRRGSAGDAAMIGGGIGAVSLGFFREKHQMAVLGAGYLIGGIVGAIRPYERWEEGWIPE